MCFNVQPFWNHIERKVMRSITIKGIPDPLYRRIKRRAAENRRSLNSEVIVCLEQSVRAEPIDPKAFLSRVDAIRKSLALPPITDQMLRAAKNAGRP
jgi:plasmid stability protein